MRADDGTKTRNLWVAGRTGRLAGDADDVQVAGGVASEVLSFYDVFAGPRELAVWDAWRMERARRARSQAA